MKNNADVIIDTRATRSLDAKMKIGILECDFKDGKIKLKIHPKDRDDNKQIVSDIESIVSRYVGQKISKEMIEKLASEILEKAQNLKTMRAANLYA